MNRNFIKYIAIIAMTIDHIGLYLINNPILYLICRFIGRITFPIMCFFIASGYKHTSNKFKYGLRLFLFALISQIPFTLISNNTIFTLDLFFKLNTIFTLFLSYMFLCTLNSNNKLIIKIPLLILISISCFLCDYKIIGLIYVLFFYFIDKKLSIALLPLLYFISTTIGLIINQNINLLTHIIINLGLFLTIPLFALYKNKETKKTYFNKYFFYIYYPLHFIILFSTNYFIN